MSTKLRSTLVFVGFLTAAYSVAALGGWATSSSVKSWYPHLAKPSWTPPSWVFGPAWTLLYTLMANVAWRIWSGPATNPERGAILRRWWLQLALNGAWSWAFFYFRSPAAGLLVIGALLVLIASMQPRLARMDRTAALLWTPYVLWVTFAACLNLSIWNRN
jgi:tryptophan-rich sensory protein